MKGVVSIAVELCGGPLCGLCLEAPAEVQEVELEVTDAAGARKQPVRYVWASRSCDAGRRWVMDFAGYVAGGTAGTAGTARR